ncbi:MAG TPA: hypothetical protein VJ953_01615 [Saprospiraceae bacterium]|nr:hypothetical protein [Saprospiraceae bacterium]
MKKVISFFLMGIFVFTTFVACEKDIDDLATPKDSANISVIDLYESTEEAANLYFSKVRNTLERTPMTEDNKTATSQDIVRKEFVKTFEPNAAAIKQFNHRDGNYEAYSDKEFAAIKFETQAEERIVSQIYQLHKIGSTERLVQYLNEVKSDIFDENSSLDMETKRRLAIFISPMLSIAKTFELNQASVLRADKCWKAAGRAALGGALIGGLRGLAKGCITGAVLGFNPGSAAAGCMGGLIVGTISGAAAGVASGYTACKIFP